MQNINREIQESLQDTSLSLASIPNNYKLLGEIDDEMLKVNEKFILASSALMTGDQEKFHRCFQIYRNALTLHLKAVSASLYVPLRLKLSDSTEELQEIKRFEAQTFVLNRRIAELLNKYDKTNFLEFELPFRHVGRLIAARGRQEKAFLYPMVLSFL